MDFEPFTDRLLSVLGSDNGSAICEHTLFITRALDAAFDNSLAENLIPYSGRLCSDPRDMIFALLHISKPIDIQVDYTKPVEEVFTDATRAIVDQEQSLDILCMTQFEVELSKGKNIETPSWVPNYQESTYTGY